MYAPRLHRVFMYRKILNVPRSPSENAPRRGCCRHSGRSPQSGGCGKESRVKGWRFSIIHNTDSCMWVCIQCGAQSGVYAVVCGACFEDKTLVPFARRPGAAIDSQPAVLRANEVLASAWRMVELVPYGLT